MQLSLFEDNRSTVLLNIAEDFIRSGDLPQALSVYDQLLSDAPDDEKVASLRAQTGAWLDRLIEINAGPGPELLRLSWVCLDTISLSSLRTVALNTLIQGMGSLPDPEFVFEPPNFHLGQMLMEACRFEEAAECFLVALADPGIPRGRLLAWRGDALTPADDAAALQCYLAAFFEDPLTVEISSIRNRTISDLHLSLQSDAAVEVDEDEAPAWLPVWGWLNGVFPLDAFQGEPCDSAAFELLLGGDACPVPRIWYLMLGYAEKLRVASRDVRELGAVRRLMKKTNGYMFGCYLEKIEARS